MYRVRGHLNAHLDPLNAEPPALFPELDSSTTASRSGTSTACSSSTGWPGATRPPSSRSSTLLRDAYCRTMGIEYMHIQDPAQKAWIQQRIEGVTVAPSVEEQHRLLERLNAAEVFERFLQRATSARSASASRAPSRRSRARRAARRGDRGGRPGRRLGMAHRGRLNVLANLVGKSYGEIFGEFEGTSTPRACRARAT